MPSDFVLVGSFKRGDDGLYYGAVAKQEGKTMTVLTVGVEPNEFLILEWIRDTIKIMRSSGQDDVQAPDMVDRAGHVH
jgi:hypothetical protein